MIFTVVTFMQLIIFLYAMFSFIFNHLLHTRSFLHFFVSGRVSNVCLESSPQISVAAPSQGFWHRVKTFDIYWEGNSFELLSRNLPSLNVWFFISLLSAECRDFTLKKATINSSQIHSNPPPTSFNTSRLAERRKKSWNQWLYRNCRFWVQRKYTSIHDV
jgi:hypothetical protein